MSLTKIKRENKASMIAKGLSRKSFHPRYARKESKEPEQLLLIYI